MLKGAAAGCCLRVLLTEWCVCVCACVRVCVRARSWLRSWRAGAAVGCRSKCGAGLQVPLYGAIAGCRCRVLLKGCLHLRNLGAATGYCCESAVCAMKLGCWCRCRGWLRDVYGSVASGSDGDYVFAIANKASDCHHNIFLAILTGVYAGIIFKLCLVLMYGCW